MIDALLVLAPTVAEPEGMPNLGPFIVKRVGFGAMQLAGPGVFGPPRDPAAARAVLRRAVELGVDHIDTSQYYGPDVVNDLIREALYPYPEELRIATKVGARRDDTGAWLPAQRPDELRAGVEDNLRSLRVERMDLVNLRLLDDEHAPPVALAEQLGALADLRAEGKIALIGLSNATRAIAEEALDLVDVACVQNSYSIIERAEEDVLALCAERGLAFVPFFPLGSAFTGGPAKLAADPAVRRVAAKHGATPSQVALSWLLHRDEHILLIPGTSSVGHLEENVAAARLALDGDDLEALDDVRPAGHPLQGAARGD
jgi:aryl-alcohol dehydrogenase-like predicted oxidoreductase